MKRIIYYLAFSGLFLIAASCNHHADTSKKGGLLSYSGFLQQFRSFRLPFNYTADSLRKSIPDSLRLDPEKSGDYIPDSIWYPRGKRHGRADIFPVGRQSDGTLHLLLVQVITDVSRKVDLLVYGKADTLLDTKEIASVTKKNPGHIFTFQLDDNYLLYLNERKELGNGHVITRERVYGIDRDGSLKLILTNTNQPAPANSFYNPIDTLPRKEHYSGDYTSGKGDLVSIRDGKDKGTFRFFIHLNKSGGDCTGELDGVGKFTGKTTGMFHDDDGPCAVRFSFSSTRVTIKEVGGCGAYRGVSCYFDGTYTRKTHPGKALK